MLGRNDRRICSCRVYDCCQFQVTDPRTQQISSGRWISYSAWRRHVKEEETRVKLERSRDDDIPLEANLLAATLSEPRVEDCVLSSHSVGIQHTSNGVSG